MSQAIAYGESSLLRLGVRISGMVLGMVVASYFLGCTSELPVEPALMGQTIQDSFDVPQDINAQPPQNGWEMSVTQRVTVAGGGTLRLGFTKNNGRRHFPTQVSVKLLFPSGAVQNDVDVTMAIDKVDLLMGVEMGFGPHDEVFNTPALLSITALNFDIEKIWGGGNGSHFICLDDGEETEYTELSMNEWNGKITLKDAKIPHFSRYAFVR